MVTEHEGHTNIDILLVSFFSSQYPIPNTPKLSKIFFRLFVSYFQILHIQRIYKQRGSHRSGATFLQNLLHSNKRCNFYFTKLGIHIGLVRLHMDLKQEHW